MSRIGKRKIEIPDKVEVTIEKKKVKIKGPKGELSEEIPDGILVKEKEDYIIVKPGKETKRLKALWGLLRSLIYNMVTGVTKGFEKKLEIHGIGYKASIKGNDLQVEAGYSHPIKLETPEGIDVEVKGKTNIIISGANKQQVGQFASEVRRLRPPEPYKGKGIRYKGEKIRRKEGKKAVGAEGPGV